MIQEVLEYKNILAELSEVINNSPFKKGYIIKETGITSPTFYRKLKDLTFTPDEVLKIIRIIRPKEAYEHELLSSIEMGRSDIEKGNVISSEDMRNEMRKRIASYQ